MAACERRSRPQCAPAAPRPHSHRHHHSRSHPAQRCPTSTAGRCAKRGDDNPPPTLATECGCSTFRSTQRNLEGTRRANGSAESPGVLLHRRRRPQCCRVTRHHPLMRPQGKVATPPPPPSDLPLFSTNKRRCKCWASTRKRESAWTLASLPCGSAKTTVEPAPAATRAATGPQPCKEWRVDNGRLSSPCRISAAPRRVRFGLPPPPPYRPGGPGEVVPARKRVRRTERGPSCSRGCSRWVFSQGRRRVALPPRRSAALRHDGDLMQHRRADAVSAAPAASAASACWENTSVPARRCSPLLPPLQNVVWPPSLHQRMGSSRVGATTGRVCAHRTRRPCIGGAGGNCGNSRNRLSNPPARDQRRPRHACTDLQRGGLPEPRRSSRSSRPRQPVGVARGVAAAPTRRGAPRMRVRSVCKCPWCQPGSGGGAPGSDCPQHAWLEPLLVCAQEEGNRGTRSA